jgi:PKD domain
MNRSTCRWIAQVAVLLAFAAVAVAQNPNCGIDQGNAQTSLPNFAGTLPSSPEMALGDGDSHLYVLTQWGVARAPRNPSNPSPYSQIVIGNEGGSGNGGVIQILCDCHQGSNTMDAAQGPNGEARVIVDWQPYAQGGPPGSDEFSGLPGMVAMASSTGSLTFGQQINLPGSVAPGADVAAIYTGSKYFGYFPLKGDDVWLADITSPTGQPGASNAIQPQNAIGWPSGILSGASVRLAAQHVTVGGYDKYLLVGGSMNDDTIHVAEINPTTGIPNEVASVGAVGQPTQIEIAQVNGHIYILSSEGAGGLQVYEYTPPASLQHIATLAGTVKEVEVRGPQPFPALFLYRDGSGGNSYVDIYDTKWLGGSGTPLLAKELQHYGSGISFKGLGFEAEVVQSGAVLTAYVHRKLNPPPPGLPGAQSPIRTDKIDISCIAADPTAPPVALATMINLSAQARSAPENTKNYFGDKWELIDSSVTYQPLTNVQWDIDTGASGPFAADPQWSGNPAQNPELEDINPAYWPCNPSGGGNLALGTACFGSVGGPVGGGTFYLGLKTTNQNGASAAYFSPGVQVLAPTVSIVGFDGSVLHVLAGNPNNGDASASTGNTGEATFSWTFTPSGNASGTVVTIPPSATGFSLLATYKDGFSVTKTGSIQQVDLVPNFSLTPTTVLKGGTMTSKNLMQKAAAATLNSVDYAFTPSGGSGTLVTCPGGFCNVNGTAPVTAPDTIGNYTLTLTYKYTDHNGAAKTGTASQPFTVTDWVPSPALGVYRGTNHTQPVPALGNPPSFGLTAGTTYYLWDDQILPNGVPHPGASFYKSSDSNPSISGGDTPIGSSAGAGPVTYAPTSCTSNCYFKVQVSGVVNAFKYTATGSGPPPPPPPPPGSVAVNGPASGSPNVSYTYTAVTNGLNNITAYEWDFGDGSGGGSPPPPPPPGPCPPVQPNCGMGLSPKAAEAFSPGSQQQPHTFAAAGNFGVKVRVTAGGTTYTSPAFTVQIGTGGPPPPLNTFDVVGGAFNSFNNTWNVAAGNVITFTAGEPDPAATFAWDFGDGDTASGNVVTHVFRRADRFTVTLTVSGGGTSTSGISEGNATFIVSPPSFQAIMVPGAGSILADSGDWATDVTITNPGGGQQGSTKVTLYFASFADEIPTDLSTLPFDTLKSVPLGPGESWSAVDVVGTTLERPGAGKGILLVKFEGGNQLPIVTARVYFTAQGASFGTALPSFLVGPFGPLTAQAAEVATGQFLIGLRDDSLYRFNISLFNASSEGGLFHVDAFSEDGVAAGSKDFAVPAYSQAGVNATDVIPNLDATKRYVLKATSTAGSLQAYSSQLDRRNNDPVQVSDDTPRVNAAPDTTVTYYVAGVGRIEENGAHWRTDLRFYNPSSFQRTVALEYHYVPAGTTTEQVLFSGGTMGAGQGVSVDDVVAQLFAPGHPDRPELMSGTVIGLLKVTYSAPPDIASAPLIIGGRIYQDFPQGTAGMQLSVYASDKSVSVSNGRLYMAGAQTNLRFRTNVGIFAMGDLPTTVRITAVKQDGTLGGQYDYRLNDPGKSGAFAQIPVTEDTFPDIDGDPMAMKVETLDGSPVGSYIVTLDNISSDTVFVQGTPVR